MAPKPVIFISHASADGILVSTLSRTIELALNHEVEVFASSKPADIPSGTKWFDKVVSKLDEASALVVLLTPMSMKSTFVMFEIGYFWKNGSNRTFLLFHPDCKIPMPVATIQGKQLTNSSHIQEFLVSIAQSLDSKLNIKYLEFLEEIALQARQLKPKSEPFSIERFEELLENTEDWINETIEYREVWICKKDTNFRIEPDWYSEPTKFEESWTKGFPDPTTSRVAVSIKINGQTARELTFISLDGGRYFVPMPKIKSLSDDKVQYYWEMDSIEMKVFWIVGKMYSVLPTLVDFAKSKGIIINE